MRGGKIMIVGTVPGDSAINFLKINREVTIQTVFRYANRYPVTIEAISSGRFDVKIDGDAYLRLSGCTTGI